jgi:hypothetical protein
MNENRSIRGQRGQTNVEWLGVMAVVVALVGAIALASPTIGKSIGCVAQKAIHKVAGESYTCSDPSDTAALPPCVLGEASGKLSASVTVFSIKGGGQVQILKQRRSDGTWLVTVVGGGELGAEFGSPGGNITVDTGSSELGGGEGAEGGLSVKGDYGAGWTFKDEKGASDAVDIIRNKLRDAAIDGAVPIVGSIGTSLFGEDRSLGDPQIEYIQGGVSGDIKGELHGGATGLDGNLSGSAVLGVRWNHEAKTKTIYLQANASGGADASLIKGLGLKGDFEGQLAITYDEKGNPLDVQVIAKGGVSGKGPVLPPDAKSPEDFIRQVDFKANASGGLRGELQLKLDLTDPDNRRAFTNFLQNPEGGAGDLTSQFLKNGRAQVRTYQTSGEDYGLDVNGKVGLKFGVEGGYEGKRADLLKAWDWDPYNGWHQSAECKV